MNNFRSINTGLRMSFFNFGPSPTKSSDASNSGDANGDFNTFGGGAAGTPSFFGRGIVEPVDSSAGSFFSGSPGTGKAGGSMFGSAESGTRQQEDANSGHAKHGLPEEISQPPPAVKKIKPEDPSQSSTPWGAPPSASNASSTANPGHSPTSSWGPPSVTSTVRPSPTAPWVAPPVTKPFTSSNQEAQSQNHHQGRPDYEAASMSSQMPPVHNYYQTQARAPPQGKSPAVLDSSAHSSALREEKKGEEDEMPADILLRDMIDMQKQQLCQLIPQMRRGEEISDQILNSARLVLSDVTNYGEKLAVTKQLYCSRLSQVSSCLRMIPKTEK